MNLVDTIYKHSLKLPDHAAREALDFIEFLEQRYSTDASARPAREDEIDKTAWATLVARFAGSVGDDFPDDIEELKWENDLPRQTL